MAYNGGRGANVNVSEYINQLNAIPTAQDTESLPFDDDLAMFTNTEWFDYDLQQNLEGGHNDGKTEALPAESFDFGQGDFSFPDFNFDNTHPSPYTNTNVLPAPVQTQPHYYPGTSTVASPTALEPPTPTTATNTAQKRKASSPLDSESLEEDSRAVAEEDKRRRNTAASARFRVKKKQREQALEKSAKEMSDKVAALEGRINQLETENKWLKNLVTEKTETKEDIATLWKKYSAEKESSPEERTKGVGTA